MLQSAIFPELKSRPQQPLHSPKLSPARKVLAKIPTRRILLYLVAVSAVYWCLTNLLPKLRSPSAMDRLTLRASVDVWEKDIPRFVRELKPQMRLYMAKFQGLKVVCAPYLRHYVKYLLFDGSGMFNPTYEVLDNSTTFDVRQKSLVCEDQTDHSFMLYTRHSSIRVHYTSENTTSESLVLQGFDSAGFQHVMDLFAGHWQCPDEGRQKYIPAGEKHVFDPAVAAEFHRSSRRAADL